MGILLPAFTFILGGCAPSAATADGTPTAGGDAGRPPAAEENVLQSNLVRLSSPAVGEDDLALLARGNTAFAAALYRELRGAEGNLFFSPYSISLTLAMVYGGARGSTESQMADALRFLLPQDRLHPAFNALDQTIAAYQKSDQDPGSKDDLGFQLELANSIWGQDGFPFLAAYLDLLAQNYGAGMRVADFAADPQASRRTINDWVEQQTGGRIVDLLPEDAITALTRLVLANAIYFKARWQTPFDPESTKEGTFTLLDGSPVRVPMMTPGGPATLPYAEDKDCQAVGLPYIGGNVRMVLLMPAAGGFDAFEQGLTDSRLESILAALSARSVVLTMPKFGVRSAFDLIPPLQALGMTDAFGAADFSGIDGQKDLFISSAVHQAFVAVDEIGTEAAAATAAAVSLTAGPVRPIAVTIDRPFLFLIQDPQTNTVLFLGRVVDPG
jgi:serpin B